MERKLLQIAVAFAGLVGVGFGLAGVVFGTAFTDIFDDGAIDSSVRFFQGDAAGDRVDILVVHSRYRTARRANLAGHLHSGVRGGLAPDGGDRPWRGEPRHPAQPGDGPGPGTAIVAVATSCRASRATRCVHLNETRRHLDILCIGVLAIGYLALYAYAVFSGRDLQPGDPIHIFRRPDAPSYS